MTLQKTAARVFFCVFSALLFCGGIYVFQGSQPALDFLTGYFIELSLSIDNLFVFATLFLSMGVPLAYQNRVLFWGIIGALMMRGIFIFIGIGLLSLFSWIVYVFGAILIFTGAQLCFKSEHHHQPKNHWLVRFATQHFPFTQDLQDQNFFIKLNGKWMGTPLLLTLILVEVTDLIFAIDSVPAVLAITKDPFIVYSSNIFAILGLRSMYFALARMLDRFIYLKFGLAFILVFVGGKIALSHFYTLSSLISLCVIMGAIGVSLAASFLYKKSS